MSKRPREEGDVGAPPAAPALREEEEGEKGEKEYPLRLRRAEWVLSQRAGDVLLVMEKVCDIHNIQATARTAESLGVQHMWIVKPPYVKNLRPDQINMGSVDEVAKVAPPVQALGDLHRYLKDKHPRMPAYTTENLAPKGNGDLWRATCTLHDGRTFVGEGEMSRRIAQRSAAEKAMKAVNPDYVFAAPVVHKEETAEQAEKDRIRGEKLQSSTLITKGADRWLSVREFETTADCVAALREEGWAIWTTALEEGAIELSMDLPKESVPAKVAVVIGSEQAGASKEMLQASDSRVFLPMRGFTESLNLSVASALILQRVFDIKRSRAPLPDDVKRTTRETWFAALNSTPKARERNAEFEEAFVSGSMPPLEDGSREARIKAVNKFYMKENPGHKDDAADGDSAAPAMK